MDPIWSYKTGTGDQFQMVSVDLKEIEGLEFVNGKLITHNEGGATHNYSTQLPEAKQIELADVWQKFRKSSSEVVSGQRT